jgi:AraC family transcriptional regulator, melibiose operon regulatory protein
MLKSRSDFQTHGLMSSFWDLSHSPLVHFHRHNEIELNLVGRGRSLLMVGGKTVALPPRTLCVFWAGFSHRFAKWEGGPIWSLSVPLTTFLGWPLPHKTFVQRLMHGQVFSERDRSLWQHDRESMQRWHNDLSRRSTEEQKEVVLLEVQARLRRMALNVGRGAALAEPAVEPERVSRMLRFIAEHYQEDLSVASIAEAAETNPSYAMEIFKESCGESIMQYVNEQRITHARRSLATTNARVLDVAMEAGFGSLSQFHLVFRKSSGQTPRAYARAHRPPGRTKSRVR